MAEPLGSRFAKLWTASTTSALGSGLATIAAPLFVAAHTRNPLIVSATTGVAWLPWLLFALPGGVLVDRVDRRRLMVTIDWIRVVVMGVLATALLAGWSSIALLDVVLFLINTGEIIFRSASQAMIPAVVPRARLERANGWLVGGTTLMQNMIAGPLAGSCSCWRRACRSTSTPERTRPARSWSAWWPERTGRPARGGRRRMTETHGRRAGSGRSWPKGSAGWPASACCAP